MRALDLVSGFGFVRVGQVHGCLFRRFGMIQVVQKAKEMSVSANLKTMGSKISQVSLGEGASGKPQNGPVLQRMDGLA